MTQSPPLSITLLVWLKDHPPQITLLLSGWPKAPRQLILLSGTTFQGLRDYLPESKGKCQTSLWARLYILYHTILHILWLKDQISLPHEMFLDDSKACQFLFFCIHIILSVYKHANRQILWYDLVISYLIQHCFIWGLSSHLINNSLKIRSSLLLFLTVACSRG